MTHHHHYYYFYIQKDTLKKYLKNCEMTVNMYSHIMPDGGKIFSDKDQIHLYCKDYSVQLKCFGYRNQMDTRLHN